MWRTIHAVALATASPDGAEKFRRFIEATAAVIPCKTCADEFARLIGSGDKEAGLAPLAEAGDAFEWTIALHDRVNASSSSRTGRKKVEWTRDKAIEALIGGGGGGGGGDDGTKGRHHMVSPTTLSFGLAVGILMAAVAAGLVALLVYGGVRAAAFLASAFLAFAVKHRRL